MNNVIAALVNTHNVIVLIRQVLTVGTREGRVYALILLYVARTVTRHGAHLHYVALLRSEHILVTLAAYTNPA